MSVLVAANLIVPSLAPLVLILFLFVVGLTLYKIGSGSKDIVSIIIIAAILLLVYPKVSILLQYPGSKLYTDAWSHYDQLLQYSQNGTFGSFSYYTALPIVYSQILSLAELSGIDLLYATTSYYLIINLITALVIYVLCKEAMKLLNGKLQSNLAPAIAVLVYSFISYPNVSIIRELPMSTGLLSVTLGTYLLLKAGNTHSRTYLVLCILAFILSLSHPFAPIFITTLFLLGNTLQLFGKARPIIAYYLILLPSMLLLSYYSLFNYQSVQWLFRNLYSSIRALPNLITGKLSLVRSGELSLDVKYNLLWERILYGFNWSLLAAFGFALVLILCLRALRERSFRNLQAPSAYLNGALIMSTLLFAFALLFSSSEYAFTRYFGTYGVIIAVPLVGYFFGRALQKSRVTRIIVTLLLITMALATLTDHDFLPNFNIGSFQRDRLASSTYATSAELLAARFVALRLSAENSEIHADGNYAPTVNFYLGYLSSSKLQTLTFSYPIQSDELIDLSQLNTNSYVLLREPIVIDSRHAVLFYSNGDVTEYFQNATS
jgi:hypothetical protein